MKYGSHVTRRPGRRRRPAAGLAVDDPGASAAFVRRFQSAVFGMAVSITRDAALART
ncbi:hypothetical protein [Ruania alba]|uniref:hypothetical protein n=1 Tax=Ruania alba TaxID=648782 RepID=UPI0015879D93|nr:hypothetical protein [Ruania alba]